MSSQNAKSIYKSLLRYGRTLQYTDKDYFYRRIRCSKIFNIIQQNHSRKFRFEFEKNSVLKDSEDLQFQIKKAEKFLTNKWLV